MKSYLSGTIILIVIIGILGFLIYKGTQSRPPAPVSLAQEQGKGPPAPVVQKEETVSKYKEPPAMQINPAKTYTAVMETSRGSLTFELYAAEAPNTVNNFVFLVRDGFYNNTVFHRIIKDFMIQGGDPTGTGRGGPGYQFKDEPIKREYVRGTLAMANAGPNTNGSQFFIMTKDTPLPKNYVIFGKVTAGLETLDVIANTPVTTNEAGENSKPTEAVRIVSITISEQ